MTIDTSSPASAGVTRMSSPTTRPALPRYVRMLARQPTLVLAWIVVLVVIGWALAPTLFTAYDPLLGDSSLSFAPPSLEHPFGADRLGRDQLARTIYGAGTTLSATLIAVLIAFVIGGALGLIAGYSGRIADTVVMRVVDVSLSIPSLLSAMVIVAVLGYSTRNIAIAVGVGSIAAFARVMRAEVTKVVGLDYVRAAYGSGVTRLKVAVRHVLPNAIGPVLALAALEIGTAILAVASLGFLGYGAPPPQPEWGLLVAEGRDFLATNPWVSILPGAALALVVIATHRISTSLGRSAAR